MGIYAEILASNGCGSRSSRLLEGACGTVASRDGADGSQNETGRKSGRTGSRSVPAACHKSRSAPFTERNAEQMTDPHQCRVKKW